MPEILPVQSTNSIPAPTSLTKGSNKTVYLVGCFIVAILLVLSGIIGMMIGRNTSKNCKTCPTTTTGISTTETSTSEDQTEKTVLKITKPADSEQVNGLILTEGEASAILEELKIKLYDDNNTFLGESTASLGVIDEKPVHTWSVYLDVAVSPTTLGGKLRVFPTDQGESSRLTQTINVQFETLSLPDRLKMYGPLRLQLMTGKPVLFRGQMKDFSDNQMHIRLKDEVGKVFFKDIIDPNEDNIGKFAYFTKTVDYKYVPSTSEKGTWEIYTIDAENQEIVIFSVPVRFKKSNS